MLIIVQTSRLLDSHTTTWDIFIEVCFHAHLAFNDLPIKFSRKPTTLICLSTLSNGNIVTIDRSKVVHCELQFEAVK